MMKYLFFKDGEARSLGRKMNKLMIKPNPAHLGVARARLRTPHLLTLRDESLIPQQGGRRPSASITEALEPPRLRSSRHAPPLSPLIMPRGRRGSGTLSTAAHQSAAAGGEVICPPSLERGHSQKADLSISTGFHSWANDITHTHTPPLASAVSVEQLGCFLERRSPGIINQKKKVKKNCPGLGKKWWARGREGGREEDEGQVIMSFSAHCFLYAPPPQDLIHINYKLCEKV